QREQVDPGQLPAAVTEAAAQMLAAVEGTVGVIVAPSRRDEVAAWLTMAGLPERVQVVDAMRAKGMEYDGVVVVEPAQIAAAGGVRVLSGALTRATRRLPTIGRDASWIGDTAPAGEGYEAGGCGSGEAPGARGGRPRGVARGARNPAGRAPLRTAGRPHG